MYRRFEKYFEFVKEAMMTPAMRAAILAQTKGAGKYLREAAKSKNLAEEITRLEGLASKGDTGAELALKKLKISKSVSDVQHHERVMDRTVTNLTPGRSKPLVKNPTTGNMETSKFDRSSIVSQPQYDAFKAKKGEISEKYTSDVVAIKNKAKADASAERMALGKKLKLKKANEINDRHEAIANSAIKDKSTAFKDIKTGISTDAEAKFYLKNKAADDQIAAYKGSSKTTDAPKAGEAPKETTFKEEAKAFSEETKTYAKDKWGRVKKYYKENPKKTIAMGIGGVGAVGAGGYMMSGNSNNQ